MNWFNSPHGLHMDVHDWMWAEKPCWSASIQSSTGQTICVFAKGQTLETTLTAASLRARAAMEKEKADG